MQATQRDDLAGYYITLGMHVFLARLAWTKRFRGEREMGGERGNLTASLGACQKSGGGGERRGKESL